MSAFSISLRSIAAHERDHKGEHELAGVIECAADEIDRLRAIVRVNGLRWGHTHAEIDTILDQQFGSK